MARKGRVRKAVKRTVSRVREAITREEALSESALLWREEPPYEERPSLAGRQAVRAVSIMVPGAATVLSTPSQFLRAVSNGFRPSRRYTKYEQRGTILGGLTALAASQGDDQALQFLGSLKASPFRSKYDATLIQLAGGRGLADSAERVRLRAARAGLDKAAWGYRKVYMLRPALSMARAEVAVAKIAGIVVGSIVTGGAAGAAAAGGAAGGAAATTGTVAATKTATAAASTGLGIGASSVEADLSRAAEEANLGIEEAAAVQERFAAQQLQEQARADEANMQVAGTALARNQATRTKWERVVLATGLALSLVTFVAVFRGGRSR